jgi:hypothetical protein
VEFSKIKLVENNLTTTLVLLVGVNKMELNIGSLEILGEAIGEKEETSDLLEELITLVLSQLALGLLHLILGQKILETKLNLNTRRLKPKKSLKMEPINL